MNETKEAIDRMAELDELIAQGWGSTPQGRIPAKWRERRGPDRGWDMPKPERKPAQSAVFDAVSSFWGVGR